MKKFLFIIAILILIAGGYVGELVTHEYYTRFKTIKGEPSPIRSYAGEVSVEWINENILKTEWTKEEVGELHSKINSIQHELNTFEGREEERLALEKYVEDVKAGRISVNINQIVAEKLNEILETEVPKITYTVNGRQIPMEVELVRAIIYAESTFNPTVVSTSGAMGIMQIMPATARGLSLDNAFDMEQGIIKGTTHLAFLLTHYKGNYHNAISAYNAGHGNVDKWLRDSRHNRNGVLFDIPFAETKAYTPKVLKAYNSYKGGS